MGFRINTNIGAMNAHANSTITARELDKSLSRLSSGLRINSAADDASGMAIADSLRSQAATLGQAINNGNDAIGILQTADKAMDEQLKILDTIKVKATQAAQDGQSTKTRNMLQADINRLMEELDNIANTTAFNGKQLLSGNFTNQEFQIGAQSNQTVKASIGPTQSSKIGVTRFETGSMSHSSGVAQLTIKNYNGIDDFKFQPVVISSSVGTGMGALAEEINRVADVTGVRANFLVETTGVGAIKAGVTSDDFTINGVKIGRIEYQDSDQNGALVAAINSVKDSTGVEASRDANGRLVLNSRDGRGIEITGDMGPGAGVLKDDYKNFGRLSLVKNDGKDILISGSGLSFIGMGAGDMISQASVSLRESKGRIDPQMADAMGFNAYKGGGKMVITFSSIEAFMSSNGSGMSAGSGFSIGSGKEMSKIYNSGNLALVTVFSNAFGFSAKNDGSSQFAAFAGTASIAANDQAPGVTTLKGAMAMMDIVETATANLDAIRADIGAVQNQITATLNNISVTQVNIKSAESNIRDVDFAAESANFSKYNILAQSGSYAMSQANAVQQNVLKLLQ
ncbi:flagellin A [Campylobacter lari]|uniref:flagellin A n=2 Tax=Campylobacter lari TaxID=201 RepID=UPI001273FFA3|nr:flagellin A [Campylobacter lari]EAH7188352.1 flagellin A [Campylobacter lari]EAJ1119266.1 flagellin A [Campylobacter lari]EAK0438085.1 flagellin A [Campylobacter lari]EAK9941651.1 flagellin A [Campylobacter lari]EEA6125852.1 flagellin A [Campylobacter lari]